MRRSVIERGSISGVLAVTTAILLSGGTAAVAQKTMQAPVTDTSVQASPLVPTPKVAPVDGSAQASPELGPPSRIGGPGFAPRTVLPIALTQAIDSGQLKNGQVVAAKLTAPVGRLPAGTPVTVTVVATVPAGELSAAGEFSLQLLRVGPVSVETETLTFRGKPGHQDLPDSAPAMGTDAGLPSGAPLTFHVQPPPVAASAAPAPGDTTPGSVDGMAIGAAPPARNSQAANSQAGGTGAAANGGRRQQAVAPGNTTSTPINTGTPAPR